MHLKKCTIYNANYFRIWSDSFIMHESNADMHLYIHVLLRTNHTSVCLYDTVVEGNKHITLVCLYIHKSEGNAIDFSSLNFSLPQPNVIKRYTMITAT